MSDLDAAERLVPAWAQPLPDEAAPCGPDLEYDNDFLAVTQAAAGKPESQFGPAEPPDWRTVVDSCETLFDRTRDLRLAILWLRGMLHLQGYAALAPGLRLVIGLMQQLWDTLHPLPDPDDGDPYARVNALTLLREAEGLVGDLRESRIVADRSIGEVTGRAVELALDLATPHGDESNPGRGTLQQMLAAALAKSAALREQCTAPVALVRELISLQNDKLGTEAAPDLRPLYALVNGVASLLPPEAVAEEALAPGEEGEAGAAAPRRGLSGAVSSREEALRAIDMVCDFLERTEPTNPAPLFLRRARQLINHNFLQLMKVLAPDSLHEVAKVVGIDPDSVEVPDGS